MGTDDPLALETSTARSHWLIGHCSIASPSRAKALSAQQSLLEAMLAVCALKPLDALELGGGLYKLKQKDYNKKNDSTINNYTGNGQPFALIAFWFFVNLNQTYDAKHQASNNEPSKGYCCDKTNERKKVQLLSWSRGRLIEARSCLWA